MNSYDEYEGEELISQLLIGGEKAFEIIYWKCAAELYRYARKNIAIKEDCEEIVHDVFESLWKRRQTLCNVKQLKAYLFQMVKYKVIRYFQHKAVIEKYADHYKVFEAAYDSIGEDFHDPRSIQSKILENITTLPERCQMAFKLRLFENLSNNDIAKRMNIKKSTVENYMVTAFSHLRTKRKELIETG